MKKPNVDRAMNAFLTETTQRMLTELGIHDVQEEDQAEMFAILSRNIVNRVLFEILKQLPETDIPEFERIFEAQDSAAMEEFMRTRIPDFDQFIQQEATREYEATKTRMHEIQQEADV